MNTTLNKLHDKAKIGILTKGSIFLSTILFSLKHSWDETIPTAGTNGKDLLINPTWYKSLSEGARIGLLCHEAYHVAFQHMSRREDKNAVKWNQAGDHLINLMLLDAGYTLPPNGLADSAYKKLSTQQIYDLLPDPEEDYDCDIIVSDDPNEQKDNEITNIIMKAITTSQIAGEKAGCIPDSILRRIDKLLNPVLPWQTLLQRFFTDKIKDDYSWAKPNKRFMPEFHLPSQYSDSLGEIVIGIDSSGSVSDQEFVEFLSEINYIHEVMKPKKLTIISFDTRLKEIHEISESDDVRNLEFKGRGGTIINPIIDYAITTNPMALLIITDGYFNKYEPSIKFDLLWIIKGNSKFNSNIGEVIHFE